MTAMTPATTPATTPVLTSTLSFPPALRQHAQGIRAAIFDVDGVLTDGTLYISESGETLKAFHALDGHGLKLLAQGESRPVMTMGVTPPWASSLRPWPSRAWKALRVSPLSLM